MGSQPPGPEKVKPLGIDRTLHKTITFVDGEVVSLDGGTREVLARPGILEEPEYTYYVDANGDLARKPKGTPWSPPAVTAHALPLEPLREYARDPKLAGIRFARLPVEPLSYYESELLEPAAAIAAWSAAQTRANSTGLTPILRTVRIQTDDLGSWRQHGHALGNLRDDARSLNAATILDERERSIVSELAAAAAPRGDLVDQRKRLRALTSEALEPRPARPFRVETRKQYLVLVVLECEPWEVPVYLGFGGWNHAPHPTELCAVLRHWYDRYRALPVAVGPDFLELTATRPLMPEEIQAVAWEQFLIAPDVVWDGPGSVDQLALELTTGRWYLYWD